MKTNSLQSILILVVLTFFTAARAADPYVDSWLTTYSSKYARIYTNDAMKTSGPWPWKMDFKAALTVSALRPFTADSNAA